VIPIFRSDDEEEEEDDEEGAEEMKGKFTHVYQISQSRNFQTSLLMQKSMKKMRREKKVAMTIEATNPDLMLVICLTTIWIW
jgi:hypothetical protein